ncbi:MAG TPA: hypothetical protein VGA78_10605 [Gemmatimonadales bacterium]
MRRSFHGVSVLAALALACSGDDDGGINPNELSMSLGNPSGNVQTGPPNAQLGPFRVRLTRGGTPASGLAVTWSVTSGGGTLNVPTSITDDQGDAEAVLTLGPTAGVVTVTATSTGAQGSPRTFNATAVVPGEFAQVEVRNNDFAPTNVAINVGGTVAFVWPVGAEDHNIVPVAPATRPSQETVRDGPFTHEESFSTVGTFQYFCSVHGSATTGMRGQVVVQ